MALELQNRAIELVTDTLRARIGTTPQWLLRPGKAECGTEWKRICAIYRDLTGLQLPDEMPPLERRKVDAVLHLPDGRTVICEFDETQHFNQFRAVTLTHYRDLPVAFDPNRWIEASRAKKRLEGGGFAKARPPLFAGENGRHRQRAFRDALCDILPLIHGFGPTLRIADFEVKQWIWQSGAREQMASLLARLIRN